MSTALHGKTSTPPTSDRPPGNRRKVGDRVVLTLMIGIPALLVLWLVWLPAPGAIALSFARWNGFGGVDTIEWVGLQNYQDVTTKYPPFWAAVRANLLLLAFLFVLPPVLGIFLAG